MAASMKQLTGDVGTDTSALGYSEMEEEAKDKERPVYNWKDVTQEFRESASQLTLGQLLHDSQFGLFEAMSAIEMMDSKMDAGMMCNQIKRKVLNLNQAIQAGDVKLKDLSYQELIGIMDSTLSCVVTWLEGHSLAQTVFTNLYFHDPHMIDDRCLKAFSLCILKIVDLIRDKVNRASVFEEEDFQPMTYGFKMAGEITEMRVIGMMKEVEDEYSKLIRNTRSKQGEEKNESLEKEHELAMAVYIRLKFYKQFFMMLLAFGKDKCEGIEQAQKLIVQLQELTPSMTASINLGIQPEKKEPTKNDYPTISGFEPLINQRLLPPTFPRYTVIRSRSDAVLYMETLLEKLHVATTIVGINSFHTIMEIFKEFSKSSPCVLSRSILQLTFLPLNRRVFGEHSIVDYLKESIRNFIAPPALALKSPLYNNPEAKQYVDALLTRAVRPMCNLVQITGHNRARQRDKYAHILEEMGNLQEEADKVDAYLHKLLMKLEPGRHHLACFGTWVLYHTLHAMISYILLGFELELYASYEYHYVFWYLYELLYAWLLSTLHRADNFLMGHDAYMDHQKGRSSKKSKKKKRTKTLNKEMTIAQAQQQMFGGYYKAVLGLKLAGKMKQPHFEFDSEEVRYTHRFVPFSSIVTPPMVHYTQYKEMTDLCRYPPKPTAEDLYTASCKCFHQAKTFYESLSSPSDETLTIIKIAKTNFVMMKLLSGGHKKDSKAPPEYDFSLHKIFPLIKL